ncbi:MAG: outer membrane lipoprotein-sorting protein [Thermoanaerobaculia bacterium]
MIRKTFAWLLLAGLAGAALQAQTVDEIIGKHLEARGGKDKIKAVQATRLTGKMVMGQGMEAPFTLEQARPNKMRMEFTLQGMTGVQAYDGKTGWAVMPFMGKKDPEPMSADDVKQLEEQADMDGILVDYKDKGHQVESLGKVDVEGTPAYKLKVTQKNGDLTNIFIDAESWLEIKREGKAKMRGQEFETEVTFGDYKPVEGLVLPFSIEQKVKGAPGGMMMTVSKIEINPSVDAGRFAMPAVEKKADPAPPKQ